MTFVTPLLLAGTALVVLPIVLHLTMRRKPKLLEFPALRFIEKRHDANRRRMRLQHLLLLLLRCAAIALLAAALARPRMKLGGALGSQEAPVAAALVVDTAARMEYRHDNETRLEAAQRLGQWLLTQLPPQSEIAVLDTQLGSAAAFQVDRGAAKQRIERLESGANAQPLTQLVEKALRLLAESDLPRKEAYVFTDLARAAWPDESAAALQDLLTEVPGVTVYVIDVGVEEPSNYGLDELRLSGQVLSNRGALAVETELYRSGPGAAGDDNTGVDEDMRAGNVEVPLRDSNGTRAVELFLEDDEGNMQKRRAESYAFGSGESRRVDFRVGSLEIGTHQGFVRIVGQDGLAADDTRYFTVEVRPAWRILVAAPKPAKRYALSLTEALAPAVFRKRGQARFDCRVVDLNALRKMSPTDVAESAAVCLVDPTPLAPAVWRKLGNFASDGGGVAIFLGRNAGKVTSFNASQAQELLPGKLLRQARRPDGDLHLAPRDYQHPILSAFRSISGAVPWIDFPVFRYWELEKPVGAVLLLSDGRPALLERPLGAGRVLTMTTPVSDDPNRKAWNLLPAGEAWPFLILVNEMMSYLVGSGDQQLNYSAGQTAVLQMDSGTRYRSYLLTAPGGMKSPLSVDVGRHQLVITATDQVGNYRVQAGGTVSGVDRGFSVNLAPGQTELQRIDQKELAEVFGPLEYRVARTRDEIERSVSTSRVGRELFGPLILLVGVLLALEYVVANRFYRE